MMVSVIISMCHAFPFILRRKALTVHTGNVKQNVVYNSFRCKS